jgi:tetratricopeptide (TPR) repeat protein
LISVLLASVLSALVLAQAPAKPAASPAPPPAPGPAAPILTTPTDDFGSDLKAWLEATKLQDQDSAKKALSGLQRRRAERNLTSLDDVAGAIAGRAEVRANEGGSADALAALDAAIGFMPDAAVYRVQKARAEGNTSDAWSALDLALANPLEQQRVESVVLLGLLVAGALIAIGFSFALLLRYGAVFSHDVAEGLPDPLKSLALSMAVLFCALPLAGFMGWGYLPFWWLALLFIFQSKPEKAVSTALLVALGLSSLALPRILHQRAVEASALARPAYLVANGGTSAEGEALVRERLAADPTNDDWSLLSASLLRRAGRFDEASAALLSRANAEPRFAHNAAALELIKGNFAGALPGFSAASEASLPARDRATALYNLSLVQVNTLAFDQSKESRKKGDALDAARLSRYDRLFSFDRAGSMLQAPPDIVPDPARVLGGAIPASRLTFDNATSRLTVVAVVLLLFIPAILKFRGAQSFSKQCPKCGTTFCWLCQTRSTSQDVCSQCHYLFVVKRGIPPAARAAKNQEITRYVTVKALLHRMASLVAPGAGHLSIGHFVVGFPLLLVWAVAAAGVVTLHYFAPALIANGPLGSTLQTVFGVAAALTYVAAQAVKPRAPVVAAAPRRVRPEQEA